MVLRPVVVAVVEGVSVASLGQRCSEGLASSVDLDQRAYTEGMSRAAAASLAS